MEIISMPSVMAITLSIIGILKLIFKNFKNFEKFIPLITAIIGIGFEILFFYTLPSTIPTDNLLTTIILGLMSGFSANSFFDIFSYLKDYINTKKINKVETEEKKEETKELDSQEALNNISTSTDKKNE